MASFHQAVAQGTEGVGLAGAGQSEGQDIDAALYEAALGQAIQLLSPGQGQTVMLEGLPGLARGQPGLPAKPGDATMAAVLRFLFQDLEESGQGVAVAGGSETSHRLGAHGGQLELVAELDDALLHDAGVSVHHPHTPAAARPLVSRRS